MSPCDIHHLNSLDFKYNMLGKVPSPNDRNESSRSPDTYIIIQDITQLPLLRKVFFTLQDYIVIILSVIGKSDEMERVRHDRGSF